MNKSVHTVVAVAAFNILVIFPCILSGQNVGIGTNSPSAKLHVAGNQKIDSNYTLEFGAGIAGKEPNAGKIGYQVFTPGALDIVGAGLNGTNRRISFWSEGGASFNGSLAVGTASEPGEKFYVNGNAKIETDLTVGGAINMGYTSLFEEYAVPGNFVSWRVISCPAGQKLLFGGGGHRDLNTDAIDIVINYNGPDPNNPLSVWRLVVHNMSVLPRIVRIYCTCARIN